MRVDVRRVRQDFGVVAVAPPVEAGATCTTAGAGAAAGACWVVTTRLTVGVEAAGVVAGVVVAAGGCAVVVGTTP
jgi:hypothetical protein